MFGARVCLVYQRILFTCKADVFSVNHALDLDHVGSSGFTAHTDALVSAAVTCRIYWGAC